jgi:hypothetical protein
VGIKGAVLIAAATLSSGCGGRVIQEIGPGASSNGGAPSSSDAGDIATNSATGGAFGSQPLGDCHLGFVETASPSRACNFLYDLRCYDDKASACACACPRDQSASTCTSGFPVENGRVSVICD